jgi:hypothetical protein
VGGQIEAARFSVNRSPNKMCYWQRKDSRLKEKQMTWRDQSKEGKTTQRASSSERRRNEARRVLSLNGRLGPLPYAGSILRGPKNGAIVRPHE